MGNNFENNFSSLEKEKKLEQLKKKIITLIEEGAEVNIRDANGNSPLGIAAMEGYVDMIALLLKSGADPNLENKNGDIPLDFSVKRLCGNITTRLKARVNKPTHPYSDIYPSDAPNFR